MILFIKTDLRLLLGQLSELSRTPYFINGIESYIKGLIHLVDSALADYDKIDKQVLKEIRNVVWNATKFLSGSSSNEVPYEAVESIKLALQDWVEQECVITTALLDEQNFYFMSVEPSIFIKQIEPDFDLTLIQIALPKLYKNRPLYSVALYHELGHFIDNHYNIVKYTELIKPITHGKNSIEYQAELRHRKEYFADLFAANYVGNSLIKFLSHLAGENRASVTHPATSDRISNIENFLNDAGNDTISMFSEALEGLKLPVFKQRYDLPDIASSFDNIRPYKILSVEQSHGIFDAGWNYYESALNQQNPAWASSDDAEKDRVINDLMEKSIRNRMIVSKWN